MKVFLDSIGCRLNQSEIEKIASQFIMAGWELAENAGEADLAIINTCTVTAKAAADSRQIIRKTNRQGNCAIIVTGCWSTIQPEAAAILPGVQRVYPNLEKDDIVKSILKLPASWERDFSYIREPLPGNRKRTRAFIKVQDGCDQHCTYCITRLARGKSRSRAIENILLDVESSQIGGAKEIVLTGVQLGSWGKDLGESVALKDLIISIIDSCDIPRIRLSSIEPWDIDEQLIRLWDNPRLCHHLHIPLQSGSMSVLRRMARKMEPARYSGIIEMIRTFVPDMAITTDVIAGFPGESEDEFNESIDFIHRISFAGGHAFSFSARQGTPAATFIDQVPSKLVRERVNRLRAIFEANAQDYRGQYLGKQVDVLWEKADQDEDGTFLLDGLSGNYLRIRSHYHANLYNHISSVFCSTETEGSLIGSIHHPNVLIEF